MSNRAALVSVDTAGGTITGPGASTFYISNKKVSLDGDNVASHGSGAHAAAVVHFLNNTKFHVDNKLVIVNGDLATCGDAVIASSNFFIG